MLLEREQEFSNTCIANRTGYLGDILIIKLSMVNKAINYLLGGTFASISTTANSKTCFFNLSSGGKTMDIILLRSFLDILLTY